MGGDLPSPLSMARTPKAEPSTVRASASGTGAVAGIFADAATDAPGPARATARARPLALNYILNSGVISPTGEISCTRSQKGVPAAPATRDYFS